LAKQWHRRRHTKGRRYKRRPWWKLSQ
jgi:hypothetical protein